MNVTGKLVTMDEEKAEVLNNSFGPSLHWAKSGWTTRRELEEKSPSHCERTSFVSTRGT